ncbi:MAG: sigma-54 dependent transcriptional regulator [Pseudomonadota bacterium]
MSSILVIEDEQVIRSALRRLLERNGYRVVEAESVEQAVDHSDISGLSLIIADLRLPGAPGTDIIDHSNGVPVLIMTSYSSVRNAVEAMKLGAVDYIAKPFDHDEMLLVIRRVLTEQRITRQNQALKTDLQRSFPIAGMIGECKLMQEIFDRIHKVAPTDATVLIQGESGTGKELVARAIHEQSPRSKAPIITVNCAAIPESLIESELFGHVKGAFTGATEAHRGMVASADGGTFFLDEIAELPPSAQAQLLRVLQNGEIRPIGTPLSYNVDVRLIAATNRNLKALVTKNLFRQDLYFRLQVMEISLPALRERGKDIQKLAEYLLQKTYKKLNRSQLSFSASAMEAIQHYYWPGNVRELENAIERAVILADTDEVTLNHLAIDTDAKGPEEGADQGRTNNLSLDDYFRSFVREHQDRLTETEISNRLGISRKSLWERRKRLGIPRR